MSVIATETPGAAEAQSADRAGQAPPRRLAWVGAWLALIALPVWMSHPSLPWLLAAAGGGLLWSAGAMRRPGQWWVVAAVALWLALGVAIGVQYRLWEVLEQWPAVEARVEAGTAAALTQALDGLVERGEEAVGGAAEAVGARRGAAGPVLFGRLEAVRQRTGVSAVALFDSSGTALAWTGEHRGKVPIPVARGQRAYVYHEGPLFSYLYFVRPLARGRTAVAAVLLEANLAVAEGSVPFSEQFERRHGLLPRFTPPDRACGESVWDWRTDRAILSVCFTTLTRDHWWERVLARGRRAAWGAWALGLVVLSLAWYRRRQGAPGVPVAAATAGLLLSPLGEIFGSDRLFDPMHFVLLLREPLPADVTLGSLLVLLTGVAVWLLTRFTRGMRRVRLPLPVQVGAVALLAPGAVALVRVSSGSVLTEEVGGGFALQLALTLLLAVLFYLLLQAGGARRTRARDRRTARLAGALLAAAMGLGLAAAWVPAYPLPAWMPALWAIPFGVVAWATSGAEPRRRSLQAWLVSGWLAGTLALSHLWPLHIAAKLDDTEREIGRLGTVVDPWLDFQLRQFANRARFFAADGETGVNLLYHSWVASGLAKEGYEARMTVWHAGEPEEELQLSDLAELPPKVREMVDSAATRTDEMVRRYVQLESLHYLLLVPLPDDRIVSVAVPPRRRLWRATPLARFLHPGTDPGADTRVESLYLVPAPPGEVGPAPGAAPGEPAVRWLRSASGWRSEALARFPSGLMHAHLLVRTSTVALLLVRGILLQTLLLAVLSLLWAAARLLCGEWPLLPPGSRRWVRSFRGRLTVTLFVFFLLPTTTFAVVAYGAVAREVVQSAAGLARRALAQAAPRAAGDSLPRLGAEVQADLLLYHQGTLVNASAPEVLDLGLFHTWLAPEVLLRFVLGEDLEASEESQLADSRYLVAYRRLEPSVVLGAPIPLASDEITRRQHEFRDIALLLGLLGLAFSVVLSLLVGRALASPIEELRRAAATVGAGNLRVRLPEERPDEFGSVYHAFNQMVRRLRQARSALVRETRRTETIVAEAATGVLALDAEGRVQLVNPRAAQILGGAHLPVGERLPADGPMLSAVLGALREFRGSRAPEWGTEMEVEGRIVRVRLRRLSGGAGERPAVVAALEDVTAEVRTARVLAWGEMARQVAHEIKNPLTPIKLAVQHLRRAYLDRRPEFGDILERNVEAILHEIDRLGEIARAFARFGTPADTVERPEAVDVPRAVQETLTLYRGGADGVHYRLELPDEPVPRATARVGELKEVLVNLLENAREALGEGGEIAVSVAPTPDGEWVEVVVADTGEGIPPELLARIFDPHFSTRTSGTGLGLAIVRRLVESWGGGVSAQSEPGVGTRVTLTLPVPHGEGAGPRA